MKLIRLYAASAALSTALGVAGWLSLDLRNMPGPALVTELERWEVYFYRHYRALFEFEVAQHAHANRF